MEEQLRALLRSDAGVTAICGQRVNFGEHPQGQDFPALVLNTISQTNGHTLQGPDGLEKARVQVDCIALTYGEARRLSRAVVALLDGHRGGQFSGVFSAGNRAGREGGSNEADRPFRVSLDFLTKWRP
ncbi:MAG: DUF3168 domain-containing protein [Cognatishimia sp.]|nr:DUF3168 domain-containing protein [Cognatishimia sp.]